MKTCFVIQPFDNNGKFDKRYRDTFEPAIKSAGFHAYRIDNDLSTSVLIDKIEEEIRNSDICFAEISSNNPNVWYELGYALAYGKNVIMVCSNEREGDFPFDIRHRHVLKYNTESQSDFENISLLITEKIKAIKIDNDMIIKNKKATESITIEGIKPHELAMLLIVMEQQISPGYKIRLSRVKSAMTKMGYNDLATSLAYRLLLKKELIQETIEYEEDEQMFSYRATSLTGEGEKLILENQERFDLKIDPSSNNNIFNNSINYEPPF